MSKFAIKSKDGQYLSAFRMLKSDDAVVYFPTWSPEAGMAMLFKEKNMAIAVSKISKGKLLEVKKGSQE